MLEHYSIWNILLFGAIIIVALLVDLHAHDKDEPVTVKNAAIWSAFWVTTALLFAGYIGMTHGADNASLFLSGYFLEKSLSVDNLFVFMAIFSSFAIKDKYQHRILYFGILGALILRFIFIAIGSGVLLLLGKWALAAFALFVLWSAYKMWKSSNEDSDDDIDYSNHWSVNIAKKFMPVYPQQKGHEFFHKEHGKIMCTPFFLCLIVVEVADIMFAFDSVPAVIAITQEPFLVYTSNIFAILGLRSMFFLLSAAKRYLCHLEKSVIFILVFIGIKMLLDVGGIMHITPTHSLYIVLGLLTMGIITSFICPEKQTTS